MNVYVNENIYKNVITCPLKGYNISVVAKETPENTKGLGAVFKTTRAPFSLATSTAFHGVHVCRHHLHPEIWPLLPVRHQETQQQSSTLDSTAPCFHLGRTTRYHLHSRVVRERQRLSPSLSISVVRSTIFTPAHCLVSKKLNIKFEVPGTRTRASHEQRHYPNQLGYGKVGILFPETEYINVHLRRPHRETLAVVPTIGNTTIFFVVFSSRRYRRSPSSPTRRYQRSPTIATDHLLRRYRPSSDATIFSIFSDDHHLLHLRCRRHDLLRQFPAIPFVKFRRCPFGSAADFRFRLGTDNENLETSKGLELSISFQTETLENQEEASGEFGGGLIPKELKRLEVKSKEFEASRDECAMCYDDVKLEYYEDRMNAYEMHEKVVRTMRASQGGPEESIGMVPPFAK
ncbi:hypothetical protein LXL04_031624 [Taraxacum kok-saghyz]